MNNLSESNSICQLYLLFHFHYFPIHHFSPHCMDALQMRLTKKIPDKLCIIDKASKYFLGFPNKFKKGEIKQMHFWRRVKPINFLDFLDHQLLTERGGEKSWQKFPK